MPSKFLLFMMKFNRGDFVLSDYYFYYNWIF